MRKTPIFDELDAALGSVVASEHVELVGAWMPATRRAYQRANQLGSGDGPFIDVIDWQWRGGLSSAVPIAAVAFLVTEGECLWSKSAPPELQPDVSLAFHAYADYQLDRATFSVRVGGAGLAVPVSWNNDPAAAYEIGSSTLRTARIETVAQMHDATFAVLILPADAVKTGRHRLWRVRDTLAAALPPQSRELLTRGRSGTIR